MGEESINVPPALKNAFNTRVLAFRRATLPPTLKVIQLPMPIAGTDACVEGMLP